MIRRVASKIGADPAQRINVFISYSRSDRERAVAILQALEARGCACSIDTRDLPYGEKWRRELTDFIRAADAVLFLVSAASIASHWCKWELAQVAVHSKRLVPVVLERVPIEDLPAEIGEVHLFDLAGEAPFDEYMAELAKVLLVDRAWIKEHTRLADRAGKWLASERSSDHLLGGRALREAETWLARRPASAPAPSQEHLDFLMASQLAGKRRTQKVVVGLTALVIGALGLAGFAYWQRGEARAAQSTAEHERGEAVKARTIADEQRGQAVEARTVAEQQRNLAQLREKIAAATASDATAARLLSDARSAEARWDAEQARRVDLLRQLEVLAADTAADADATGRRRASERLELRRRNLTMELEEATTSMRRLEGQARSARASARSELEAGHRGWTEVQRTGGEEAYRRRQAPLLPKIFSIEILGVGFGESMLLHYGDRDAPAFILVDGGQRQNFVKTVEPRLRALKSQWSPDRRLPLQAVIVTNQDDDRLGGVEQMLKQMLGPAEQRAQAHDIRRVWYNGFGAGFPGWQKSEVLRQVRALKIPLNDPFDALVMRPGRGRVTVDFGHGLTATVLNPAEDDLKKLHKTWVDRARQRDHALPLFPREGFSRISVAIPPRMGPRPPANVLRDEDEELEQHPDRSVVNLASIAVLYEFGGKRFLHPGDSRGDQILLGLAAAGLLERDGRIDVDVLLLPHAASHNNVSTEFFRRVKAEQYLFSAHGRHGSKTTTIQMILRARKGDSYTINFLHRDGERTLGEELDSFLAAHPPEEYGYQRIFRSSQSGSLFVDLQERVRY